MEAAGLLTPHPHPDLQILFKHEWKWGGGLSIQASLPHCKQILYHFSYQGMICYMSTLKKIVCFIINFLTMDLVCSHF